MSNKKISQLSSGGALLATDWYPIRRGSANYYLTGQMIIDACLFDDSQILSSLADLQTNKLNLDGSNGPMLGNLDMGSFFVTSTGVPTANNHLVNKLYVDGKFLPLSGGTLSGFLTLHANPVNPLHAATKQYVDQLVAAITGGAANTNQLPEGTDGSATGLGTDTDGNRHYFTGARFDARFATKTTDNLSEGSVNKYFTTARFDLNFSSKTTDNLVEGSTNLYFTNNRARTALSAIGPILYNDSTGVISFDTSILAGVSFGGANMIPYVNSTTDDFLYSSNLTFTGSKLITARLQVGNYDLPLVDGTINQFLITNGSGVTTFATKTAADLGGVMNGGGDVFQVALWSSPTEIIGSPNITWADYVGIDVSLNLQDGSYSGMYGAGIADIAVDDYASSLRMRSGSIVDQVAPLILFFKAKNALSSPLPLSLGHVIGEMDFLGTYNTSGSYRAGAAIRVEATQTWSSTMSGTQVGIFTLANGQSGNLTERFAITGAGRIRFNSLNTFPDDAGFADQVLATDGLGNLYWTDVASSGSVGGSGLTDRVAKWTSTTNLGYGIIRDNGTVGINIDPISTATVYLSTASTQTGIKSEVAYTGNSVAYAGYFYANGIHSSDNVGIYAAAEGSNGGLNGHNIGVYGLGVSNGNTTQALGGYFKGINNEASAQAISVGIQAIAAGSTPSKYAAWLQDGTETVVGRFLRNMTNDGKANWAPITVSDISDLGNYALVGTYNNGRIPRWNSATNTLASGSIYDNGSEIGIGGTIDTNYIMSLFSGAKATTVRFDNTRAGSDLTNTALYIASSGANVSSGSFNSNSGLTVSASGASGVNSSNIGLNVFANTSTTGKNIGGVFSALNGVGTAHAVKLTDGSEGAGKFLISTDSTGLANWSTINNYAEKLSPSISADYVLIWDGSSNLHKKVLLGNLPGTGGGGGGSLGGGGTANYLARWTNTSNLGIGTIQDNGTAVIAGDVSTTFSTNYYIKSQTSTHRYGALFETMFAGGGPLVGLVGRTVQTNYADVNVGVSGYSAGNAEINIGVQGVAEFTSATATNIGGEFEGKGGAVNYPLRLVSADLSAYGKYLKAFTADGKADWATITASDVTGVQVQLVSGTTIKTINGQSILGSGNLQVTTTGSDLYNFNNFI